MSQHGKSNHYMEYLLKKLRRYKPFVYTKSADGVSIYIHFRKLPGGLTHKLRISNHNERSRYGYKWQLRWDGGRIERKQYSRYFTDPKELISAFITYYDKVKESEKKKHETENNTDRR